ncbi:DSE1 (YER124C) [Zygosaccharomyces parabailii]|nr:DSE1 (YER124C) [Zygosaccharomyces parabailii]CDH16599.1 related to Protein DSE1 [Zygosaccharomyces bailii ISA1307]
MGTGYYQPVNVFRQPAISVKTRNPLGDDGCKGSNHHSKSWLHNTSRMGSPLLRKVSDEFNDHYLTKKLKSEFWRVNPETSSTSVPTDLSVVRNCILLSNMETKDNLKLYELSQDRCGDPTKLYELQTISVPGKPITSASLLSPLEYSADYVEGHDQLMLAGHQDGVVNLISSSRENGNAKIVKRYNHGKYLSRNSPATLDNWLESYASLPIRHLEPWAGSGFTSVINDSLFIYDMNRPKAPQYLQSFPGLESFAINNFRNPYLMSLCGSQFGNSGIALLDLRGGSHGGNLYIPDSDNVVGFSSMRAPMQSHVSRDCVWIDEFHVVNCSNDVAKIWDIRSTSGETKCEIIPMRGCIESLKYHEPTKTLYTGDDQGYIISWDLQHMSGIKKCILAQGFNSILMESAQEDRLHEVNQCGSIVVNGGHSKYTESTNRVHGSVLMGSMGDGSLATLDSRELGLHQICQVKCPVEKPKRETSLKQYNCSPIYHYDGEKIHNESESTLMSSDASSISSRSSSVGLDGYSSYTLNSETEHEPLEYNKQFTVASQESDVVLREGILRGSTDLL